MSLGEEIKGWISGRYVRGSADVSSPTGGGILDAEEIGASIGARWQNANNYYAAGCFSLSDYNIDISSDTRGRLKSGVGGNGNFLTFEAGRRIAFGKTAHLTPRAWLARSEVSMDKFTDGVDSRVSFSDSERLTGGVGMMAETTRTWGDIELSLQGSLGIERIFRGAQTRLPYIWRGSQNEVRKRQCYSGYKWCLPSGLLLAECSDIGTGGFEF